MRVTACLLYVRQRRRRRRRQRGGESLVATAAADSEIDISSRGAVWFCRSVWVGEGIAFHAPSHSLDMFERWVKIDLAVVFDPKQDFFSISADNEIRPKVDDLVQKSDIQPFWTKIFV